MTKTRTLPPWLWLAVPLFLAPLLGGQVAAEPRPLPADAIGALAAAVGGDGPTTAHVFLGLMAVLGLLVALIGRKVIQLPAARLTSVLLLLAGVLLVTSAGTQYRASTLAELVEWGFYFAAFFASVALAGRGLGPRALLAALVAGCAFLSLKGLVEYGQMRQIDPSWRIFAGWVNANALAGMLLLGLPLAMALSVTSERLGRLLAGIAACLITLALLLTQSKGGLIGGGVALALFLMLAPLRSAKAERAALAVRLGVLLVAMVAMGGLLMASQRGGGGATAGKAPQGALARVVDTSGTEAQSFTFRKNLWQSAVALVRTNPLGYGMGTYRYQSAKPGITPQTHFAHQSFLQLAVEASPIAAVLLVLFGVLWLRESLRKDSTLPGQTRTLRIAVAAALVGSAAHSCFDSDLYQFGIGFAFFALLGIGTELCSDAVTPEYLAPRWKGIGIALAIALGVGAILASASELALGRLVGAVVRRDRLEAQSALSTAKTWAASDGDTWRFAALLEPSPKERVALLERAARICPSPKNERALAAELVADGQADAAQAALSRALLLDPNNLLALRQRMELRLEIGDRAGAHDDARRLVAIESTPYFTVRALPEIVPTETYAARRVLAQGARSPAEKVTALAPAVAGGLEYAARTVPFITQQVESGAADPSRIDELRKELEAFQADAQTLAALYRELGRSDDAGVAETSVSAFGEALAGLPSR
ncbi:MAG: O-antigen ligase family protein [Fimbriimonadaceae bacterium]|nr:O-antigen ligase family protein [Fimbriimonadaceae bacterium]